MARTVSPTVPGAAPERDTDASPAARAHRQQLARVARLRAQLAELDALEQAQRSEHLTLVAPLHAQHVQLQKRLVQALDAALQEARLSNTLSATQRAIARERLCDVAQALAEDGHADMAALHDAHSPLSLVQKRRSRADDLRAQIEAALGAPLEGLDGASPEAVLHAGFERLREADSDQRDAKRKKRDARKARAGASADATAPALQGDADTLLRRLYRQLASALHPDREPDAALRQRKTALMSEANAAYEKRDLLALLDMRQRMAEGQAAPVPEDQLAALTLLMKQQVAALERERAAGQQALARQFGLPEGVSANANTLRQARIDEVQRLEHALAEASYALSQTTNGVRLKRWLNGLRHR